MPLTIRTRKALKRIFSIVLLLFILLNIVAYIHAYRFTHFEDSSKTRTSQSLTFFQKLGLVFTGISNPRPQNTGTPAVPYEAVVVSSNQQLSCWFLKKDTSHATIILFHGYGGEKSSMLDKAYIFLELGLNVLLVDFMGSGSSGGNATTIGFDEAIEVRDCFN